MITQVIKDKALEIIGLGVAEIISNYSENALLINACHIAKDRYSSLKTATHLSTTQNIPEPLRLDNEIQILYNNNDLVRKYNDDVQKVVYKNYIVVSVSLVDATLENLYEHFIYASNPGITEADAEKQIRNAWTNDSMLNYFTDVNGLNMKQPNGLGTEFKEAFMRYSELRIVRHTLLHTSGKLSDKNYSKLQSNFAATPAERQHMALANAPIFDANRKVVLNVTHVLSIRQYLDRFLMYIYSAVNDLNVTL